MRVVTNARRDEHGAIAVIVAISAVMLFGFAAYAVDAGHAWETRRNMVTASDAGALAAAGAYAVGDAGCDEVAVEYLGHHDAEPASDTDPCVPNGAGSDQGYVTVRGETTAQYAFAGIFGTDSSIVRSTTTAEWGLPKSVSGLRPYAFCISPTQEPPSPLLQWLNRPTGPTGPSGDIRLPWERTGGEQCGGAPGNWGLIDFEDGGSPDPNCSENGAAKVKCWVTHGYSGELELPSIRGPKTGAVGGVENALDDLVADPQVVGWPIYEERIGTGDNARYKLVAVVFGTLKSAKVTGPNAGRHLTIQFDHAVVEGTCCSTTGIDTGVRALRICGVLPGDVEDCHSN